MLNICLILPNVFPVPATKGGAVETLVENLINENEKKHSVNFTCISVYEEKAYKLSKNYKYTEFFYVKTKETDKPKDLFFESLDESFIEYMDTIYSFIKDKSFDFVIFEGGDWVGYKYLLDKIKDKVNILHIHGVCECTTEENANLYDYYLSISEYVTNKFTESGFVSKDKIFTIYNGIDLSKFDKNLSDKEKIDLKNKYNINANDVVLVFCGRTVKEKGIKELLLACKDIDNIKVLIVGNSNFGNEVVTDYDRELVEISKEMNDKIIFTGFIHNDELYKIYKISDIGVVPSIYEEGFGLVVIEEMASNLPIIATKSGAIPELVDSKCGIIIEKDENLISNLSKEISYLAENKNVRIELGKNGKEKSKIFSKEQFFMDFVKTFYEIKSK